MKRFYFCSALLLLLFSCSQGINEEAPATPLVIKTGFESMTDLAGNGKTSVAGSQIRWTSAAQDKVLYVFDSKGVKNVFTSSESAESATRYFSGTISNGS